MPTPQEGDELLTRAGSAPFILRAVEAVASRSPSWETPIRVENLRFSVRDNCAAVCRVDQQDDVRALLIDLRLFRVKPGARKPKRK